MGIRPRRSIRTFASTLSTQTTSLPVSARQAPTTRPTYPVPTTAIFIRVPTPVAEAAKAETLPQPQKSCQHTDQQGLPRLVLRGCARRRGPVSLLDREDSARLPARAQGTDRGRRVRPRAGSRPGPPTAARRRAGALHQLLGRSA